MYSTSNRKDTTSTTLETKSTRWSEDGFDLDEYRQNVCWSQKPRHRRVLARLGLLRPNEPRPAPRKSCPDALSRRPPELLSPRTRWVRQHPLNPPPPPSPPRPYHSLSFSSYSSSFTSRSSDVSGETSLEESEEEEPEPSVTWTSGMSISWEQDNGSKFVASPCVKLPPRSQWARLEAEIEAAKSPATSVDSWFGSDGPSCEGTLPSVSSRRQTANSLTTSIDSWLASGGPSFAGTPPPILPKYSSLPPPPPSPTPSRRLGRRLPPQTLPPPPRSPSPPPSPTPRHLRRWVAPPSPQPLPPPPAWPQVRMALPSGRHIIIRRRTPYVPEATQPPPPPPPSPPRVDPLVRRSRLTIRRHGAAPVKSPLPRQPPTSYCRSGFLPAPATSKPVAPAPPAASIAPASHTSRAVYVNRRRSAISAPTRTPPPSPPQHPGEDEEDEDLPFYDALEYQPGSLPEPAQASPAPMAIITPEVPRVTPGVCPCCGHATLATRLVQTSSAVHQCCISLATSFAKTIVGGVVGVAKTALTGVSWSLGVVKTAVDGVSWFLGSLREACGMLTDALESATLDGD